MTLPYQCPKIPESFSAVQALSTEELRELLEDESKFDQFCERLSEVQAVRDDINLLRVSNRSLAEENLRQEPQLVSTREQLKETYATLASVQEALEQDRAQIAMHAQRVSPQAAQQQLEEKTAARERHTEELAEEFVEGRIGVEQFLERFTAQRRESYIQRVHTDKFRQLSQHLPSPLLPGAHGYGAAREHTHNPVNGAHWRNSYDHS